MSLRRAWVEGWREGRRLHEERHAPRPTPPKAQPRARRGATTATPQRRRRLLPPSDYQVYRARALAVTREVFPDMVTTRAERFAAIDKILAGCSTRKEADAVLRVLRTRPPARFKRWEEKTARFEWLHTNQVRRLQGLPEIPWAYTLQGWRQRRGWSTTQAPVVMRLGPLTEPEQSLVDLIVTGRWAKRPTAQEIREWHDARVVRHDPDWGPLMVGGWE